MSAGYVARKLKKYGGWKVETQPFDFVAFYSGVTVGVRADGSDSTTYEEDTDYSTMEYSGSGDVTAEDEAFDPRYHQACDDIDNISRRGLREMSDSVAHSVGRYATNMKFIPRPEMSTKQALAKAKKGEARTDYLGDSLRR